MEEERRRIYVLRSIATREFEHATTVGSKKELPLWLVEGKYEQPLDAFVTGGRSRLVRSEYCDVLVWTRVGFLKHFSFNVREVSGITSV